MTTGAFSQQPLREVLAGILCGKNVPLTVVIAAGELIVADARFNLWFAGYAKVDALLSDDESLTVLADYDRVAVECATAWNEARSKDANEVEASLLPVLRAATISVSRLAQSIDADLAT